MLQANNIAAGQRWRSLHGGPDIQITGRATNADGWAVTSSPSRTPSIVSTAQILADYVLIEEFHRPSTGRPTQTG